MNLLQSLILRFSDTEWWGEEDRVRLHTSDSNYYLISLRSNRRGICLYRAYGIGDPRVKVSKQNQLIRRER